MQNFLRLTMLVLFFLAIIGCNSDENSKPADTNLYAGQSVTFTAGSEESVFWKVVSATVDNYDCSSLFDISPASGNVTTITLPLRFDDVRCADKVTVVAAADDGSGTVFASKIINIIPVPDRGLIWTEDSRNPVVDLQTCPDWGCLGHTDPSVGRLDDSSLVIWFSAGGDWGLWPVIGRAVESGTDFVLDAEPVIYPKKPAEAVPDPLPWDYIRETVSLCFDKTSQKWKMWYLGYSVDYFTDPALGQASSLDAEGTQWERSDNPLYRPGTGAWDSDFMTSPSALMGPDGIWRLYYTGASFSHVSGKMRIGMLTSEDGETWTVFSGNPVFEGVAGQWDESILDSHVRFMGGRYVMWYSALIHPLDDTKEISIGVATSEDGITWTRYAGNPVLSPSSPVAWNDFRVLDPEVFIEEDGSLTLVGYGVSSTEVSAGFYPDRLGLWKSGGP